MIFRRFFRLPRDAPKELLPNSSILTFFANILMKDGRKSDAQEYISEALVYVRTKTHNDPVKLAIQAIEEASPLMKLSSTSRGAKVIHVPKPLNSRQRLRTGIKAIIDSSDKRKERKIGERLGAEIVAVLDGTSSALEKKLQLHKLVLVNRSNIKTFARK